MPEHLSSKNTDSGYEGTNVYRNLLVWSAPIEDVPALRDPSRNGSVLRYSLLPASSPSRHSWWRLEW